MSKPRYRWWGFARRMIRDYPRLKYEYDELHQQSLVADMSGMPKGGGTNRTVESVAGRHLPDRDDQKAYDAVAQAVEATKLLPDGAPRLAMIRYVYWNKKPHTVKDAALKVYASRRTAERWHAEFVRLVGKCYGFEVGGLEPKKHDKLVE